MAKSLTTRSTIFACLLLATFVAPVAADGGPDVAALLVFAFPEDWNEELSFATALREGDPVVFVAVFEASEDAPATDYRFRLDGADLEDGVLGADYVEAATWPATLGAHTLEFIVDPLDALAEADETNNVATRTFTVLGAFDPVADLTVTAVNVDDPLPTGAYTTASMTVTNTGDAAAGPFAAALSFGPVGYAESSVAGLAPGESTQVYLQAYVREDLLAWGTTVEWYATADLYSSSNLFLQVAEDDRADNTLEGNVAVALPDLVVGSFEDDGRSYGVHERATFYATIGNEGPGYFPGGAYAGLYVDDVAVDFVDIEELGPGWGGSLRLEWTVTPGEHTFELRLNEAGNVPETNTSNNAASFDATFLFDVEGAFTFVADDVHVAASTGIQASFTNTGRLDTMAGTLRILVDGDPIGEWDVPSGIRSGSTHEIGANWAPLDTLSLPGTHVVTAEFETFSTYESDPGDDVAEATVDVVVV